MDQMLCLKGVLWRIFLSYPYKHESMFSRVLALLKSTPPALILGVNTNLVVLGRFYPKIMVYCNGLDASKILKCDILSNVRVTHEDLWK